MNTQGIAYKLNRKFYPRLFSRSAGYVIVNEFPKSGGTWLSSMLSDALRLPFPRHEPLRVSPSIVHGHFLSPSGLSNVIALWRDPRDIFVSYYFHCYFRNEHHNGALVERMKKALPFDDYSDAKKNMPAFIRFLCDRPQSPSFTWMDFAARWSNRPNVVHTTYETLRQEPAGTLQQIVWDRCGVKLPDERASAIADRHSFAKAKAKSETAGLQAGEMSFVRSGSVGGWTEFLDPDDWQRFSGVFEKPMSELGYNS